MQLLHERPKIGDQSLADAEVLIREARRLRHRRWAIGILLTLVLAGGTTASVSYANAPSSPKTSRASGATITRVRATAGSTAGPVLKEPANLAIAPDGNLYIADVGRDQILVRLPTGRLHIAVGDGATGNTGDGGQATKAEITAPNALTFAPNGTLYFMSGTEVRAVSPAGIITTVVGGSPSASIPARNGALATDVSLGDEDGLAGSPSGVLYLCPYGSPSTNDVFAIEHGRLVEIVSLHDLLGVNPTFPDDRDLAPYGIAFDQKGDLFLLTEDPRAVIVREPNGVFRYVGQGGNDQVTNPFAAFGDTLYVAGLDAVVRFSPDIASAQRTPAPRTDLVASFVGDLPGHENLDPGGIAITPGGDVITDGDLSRVPEGESGTHAVLIEISPVGKVTILGEWAVNR